MILKWLFRNIILLGFIIAIANANTNYKYSYIPKSVFATQVFPVTILIEGQNKDSTIEFEFNTDGSVQPISKKPIHDINGENTFYTFYFKAVSVDIEIPSLTIYNDTEFTTLKSRHIPVIELDSSKHPSFCGLIATNCKIITYQVSPFDADNNLVSVIIKATEANPEDIKIPNSLEFGIEKNTLVDSTSTVELYFVIPSSQKSTTTSYYNTMQHKFISKTFSTDFKNKTVAAQENLNPRDSSFDKLKKYGLSLLAIFFFWMFWKRKDMFYLVLFVLVSFVLVTIFMPHEKLCVQEGSALYILPTSTSTTSGQIDRDYKTDILNQRGKYYKIEYDHGIIGWVRHENLCND